MPKAQKDHLFDLVKSLSKSEKRQFKLFVGRLGGNEDSKFLKLFTLLERMTDYHEESILSKVPVKKQQLSNLKAHLHKQILISLRLNPSHQNIRLQIREQLDFATILYRKGLYQQSLKILDRAKSLALENEEKNVAYEIIELEKVIESQYITRSISNRAEQLTKESAQVSKLNILSSELSNLSLQLYGVFLKSGYAKNDEEFQQIKAFFNERMPSYALSEMGFRERLWLYKAYLWYSFLTQDFLACYRYAKSWVDLFYDHPEMIQLHPVFFLRGKQYLLEALFFIKDRKRFRTSLQQLDDAIAQPDFPIDDNLTGLIFLYQYSHRLNLHFLEGTYKEALPLIDEVLAGIQQYQTRIDAHHIMMFYYKIACIYFGNGHHKQSIEYLSKIIENKSLKMREDLLCFARILNLVAHYEAGMDYHLDRLIKSTYKFLLKMEDLYQVQKEMIKFLRGLGDIYPHQIKDAFRNLHAKLKAFENDPFERRSFLYLDILSWLESNIESRPIDEIIREKIAANKIF